MYEINTVNHKLNDFLEHLQCPFIFKLCSLYLNPDTLLKTLKLNTQDSGYQNHTLYLLRPNKGVPPSRPITKNSDQPLPPNSQLPPPECQYFYTLSTAINRRSKSLLETMCINSLICICPEAFPST